MPCSSQLFSDASDEPAASVMRLHGDSVFLRNFGTPHGFRHHDTITFIDSAVKVPNVALLIC